jgi:hypothetical protein
VGLEVKLMHIAPLHYVEATSGVFPRREAPEGWAIIGADLNVMAKAIILLLLGIESRPFSS